MRRKVSKIDEITEVVTKGTTPTTYGMPFTDSGVNFIKAEALNGDSSLDRAGFAFVSESTHEKLKRSILAEGDILVTIAGAQVGRCGIVRAEHLPANTNQAVGIIRVLRERANPRFIYYFFKNPQTFRMCQGIGGQAAQPNINLTVLKGFDLPLPDLQNQDAIVGVLSAYDDLIENNRRRIALLEEAARLLYREWFVHLRFPGHESVKITDGIPEAWERMPASDVFEVNPRTDRNDEGTITYVPMAALSEVGMTIDQTLFEMRPKATGVRFRNGDTLLARITPSLENGKTGFVQFLRDNAVACGSTEFIVLRGHRVSNWFVYLTTRQADFRENAIRSMIGSSGRQRVQASCFDRYHIAVPPRALAKLFDEAVGNLFEQVANLDLQNEKLSQARDLLLPRLMSGEIAV